jgi:hypothetical protein
MTQEFKSTRDHAAVGALEKAPEIADPRAASSRVTRADLMQQPTNSELKPQRKLSLYKRTRNQPGVLKELSPEMVLMLDYMTHGCPHQWAEDKLGIARGTPLSLEHAADLVGIRRRNARQLFQAPLIQRTLAAKLQALRDGHKAEAVHKVIATMRRDTARAADAKVSLEAAAMILGEQTDKRSPGVTVNVGVQVSPGYVIRLPTTPQQPVTIDASPNQTTLKRSHDETD